MSFDRQISLRHRDHPELIPDAGRYVHTPPHQTATWRVTSVRCPYCEHALATSSIVGHSRVAALYVVDGWMESVVSPIPSTHDVLFCTPECGQLFVMPKELIVSPPGRWK